jgi:hypothetical protein
MEVLSNVVFSNNLVSDEVVTNYYKTALLDLDDPYLNFTILDMVISDVATEECLATFRINAVLVSTGVKNNLQTLLMKSSFKNTYRLSLDFFKPETDTFSLCGRNTSENRAEARKLLLAGLSSANYNSNIEKARRDVLYSFSNYIVSTLFDPSVKAQENVPLINTWLVKLLG